MTTVLQLSSSEAFNRYFGLVSEIPACEAVDDFRQATAECCELLGLQGAVFSHRNLLGCLMEGDIHLPEVANSLLQRMQAAHASIQDLPDPVRLRLCKQAASQMQRALRGQPVLPATNTKLDPNLQELRQHLDNQIRTAYLVNEGSRWIAGVREHNVMSVCKWTGQNPPSLTQQMDLLRTAYRRSVTGLRQHAHRRSFALNATSPEDLLLAKLRADLRSAVH